MPAFFVTMIVMQLSRGKKIVLISTAIMAGSILVAGYALIDFMKVGMAPPHKATPLQSPIPTEVVSPPFKSPANYVTGRNQTAQAINKAGGLGAMNVRVDEFFSGNATELQDIQADIDSLSNLYHTVKLKISSHAAHAMLKHISDAPIPYIHPDSLKEVSPDKFTAVSTAGFNVTINKVDGEYWKQPFSETDSLGIMKQIAKPLSKVFDSATAEVDAGKLDTVKSITQFIDNQMTSIINDNSKE